MSMKLLVCWSRLLMHMQEEVVVVEYCIVRFYLFRAACLVDLRFLPIIRLRPVHEMQTIHTSLHSVCLSVFLYGGLSVCHECTEWPHTVKPAWDLASLCGVIWCSLCQITLASCLPVSTALNAWDAVCGLLRSMIAVSVSLFVVHVGVVK